jgi:predicted dehydrogenase
MTRPFTVTRAEARELKRRSESLRRHGGGIPHEVVRRAWLAEMERELRAMVRAYDGGARKGRELLEALLVAEEEGVRAVAEIRRVLAEKVRKRQAA